MRNPNLIISIVILFAGISLHAQKGFIRGTILEEATGEPIFSVAAVIKGTSNGATTDFDGKFQITVDPGIYDLQISFVSFQTVNITGLEVVEGAVNVIDVIYMKEDVELLEAVVIEAEIVKTTVSALNTVKRKSANLIDGISSASFRKIGDSDAADAIKRVTGVSVESGKYVYVRGLGDRYTKTMLNSIEIPGLDPDRNSLQIDIFPTNLLSNMIVSKSASANLPADFTGGLVNIETMDFPDQKIFDVSVGMSFNPSMHFQNEALTYQGSSTDWLGFDTDLREIPGIVDKRKLPTPFIDDDNDLYSVSKAFEPKLEVINKRNFMNYSIGFTYGDQKAIGRERTLGYFMSGNYKKNNEFYNSIRYGEYQKRNETDVFNLGTASTREGAFATENTLLGGLAGIAFKTKTAKLKFSAMHLQNGEKKAADIDVVSDPSGDDFTPRLISDYRAISNNLEYFQRSLTNFLLSGEHHFLENTWEIDWKLSPTISKITDPDIRRAAFSVETGNQIINAGAAGPPSRIWRFLDEANYVSKINITNDGTLFNRNAKFKFGLSYVGKNREYSIQTFQIASLKGSTEWPDNNTFSNIVDDTNLFPNANGNQMYYQRLGIAQPNNNAYESSTNNLAAYFSTELSPLEKLKVILGMRMEMFEQRHTGRDQTAAQAISNSADPMLTISQIKTGDRAGNVLVNDIVLDATDFFPSFNSTYALDDNQNLRLSYSKTIARPSFKELSYAQILDPVSSRTFIGGFFPYFNDRGEVIWDGNLTATYIRNFDLRWELFMNRGQILSVSAFYKAFDDPIELVRITISQTGREFQPRNVGDGRVLGLEFEFRKSLDFINPSFSNFSLNGNVTIVDSRIDMTSPEYESRLEYEKDGERIQNTRDMAGQAPYVLNLGFQYDNYEDGLDASISYNVKGETLLIVGEGFFPDIYSQPFHSLNFNFNYSLGLKDRAVLNLSISNILNDKREDFFTGFNADNEIFTQLSPGRTIGMGIKYSL